MRSTFCWSRPRSTFTLSVIAVGASLSLGGCAERRLPTANESSRPLSSLQPVGVGKIRLDEEPFAELAQQLPSSAGFYLDSTGFVVVVSNAGEDVAAKGAIDVLVAAGRIKDDRAGSKSIRVQRGQYTFEQLRAWRDVVFEKVVGASAGITSLDLTEHLNRVTIGIAPEQMLQLRTRLPSELVALGVDTSAIIYINERSIDLSTSSPSRSFTSKSATAPPVLSSSIAWPTQWDTLVGGIYITGAGGGGGAPSVS